MPVLSGAAPLSRRGLLSTLATLGSAAGAAATAMAGPPRKIRADIDPSGLLVRLVQRTNYGVSETELARAESLGYHGYLEYQLNHTAILDTVNEAQVAQVAPTLTESAFTLYPQNHATIANQLTEATIRRAAFSNRGLYQRMVEFWTDHFNIDNRQANMPPLKTVDDRDVIRANAMGNFGTLLRASAHSAAMLMYLDNDISTAAAPNENYAREIMELHSMGVDGGYTQTDVEQVARCFTGWGRWPFTQANIGGSFRYNAANHRTGVKIIFSGTPQQVMIPDRGQANGQLDGDDVLTALIAHPSTARFIAKKLAMWFLGETVPQQTIDEIAAEYTRTAGDIKSMIRVALKPEHLATSPMKLKRPFHVFVSALRTLPVTITSTSTLRDLLNQAGHQPFTWSTPDGFPDNVQYWVGGVLSRWNYGARLLLVTGLNPGISGISVNVTSYLSGLTNSTAIVQKINRTLFGGEMTSEEFSRLNAFLALAPTNPTQQRETIGLAIGAPSFQWY